jgi:hypothetical protein
MEMIKPDAKIIYESSDHGETIYGRYAGTKERWVVRYSQNAQDRLESIKQDKLWGEIRQAAKFNQALQSALDRAKIIYELSKQDGEN